MRSPTQKIPPQLKEKYSKSSVETLKQRMYAKREEKKITKKKLVIKVIFVLFLIVIIGRVCAFIEQTI